MRRNLNRSADGWSAATLTRPNQEEQGTAMTRWVTWVGALLHILMKIYPARIAELRRIFPSLVSGRVGRHRRCRPRDCSRYVDCTKNMAHRRRMR